MYQYRMFRVHLGCVLPEDIDDDAKEILGKDVTFTQEQYVNFLAATGWEITGFSNPSLNTHETEIWMRMKVKQM